jgi:hypothetical protein
MRLRLNAVWALMVAFDGPVPVPFEGGREGSGEGGRGAGGAGGAGPVRKICNRSCTEKGRSGFSTGAGWSRRSQDSEPPGLGRRHEAAALRCQIAVAASEGGGGVRGKMRGMDAGGEGRRPEGDSAASRGTPRQFHPGGKIGRRDSTGVLRPPGEGGKQYT